jgi:hypothetical protein
MLIRHQTRLESSLMRTTPNQRVASSHLSVEAAYSRVPRTHDWPATVEWGIVETLVRVIWSHTQPSCSSPRRPRADRVAPEGTGERGMAKKGA